MKAIITVGISASGKSTWAEAYVNEHYPLWRESNRDWLRFNCILDGTQDWSQYKFNKANENTVTQIQEAEWQHAAHSGKNLIISDTNLNTQRREELKSKLEALGYEVEYKFFPIELEEAWKRDALRANGVGRDVIYKQWQQWNETTNRRVYVPNVHLPKAVMFDIDGTLAHMDGKRGPFDWTKVGEDRLDGFLSDMLYHMSEYNEIVIMSGRDSVCRQATMDWLYKHDTQYAALVMRSEGDVRKDSIVKEELFFNYVAPFYNVVAVFDDRPQVVRMWYDIKIPKVFSCANPYIEF